MITLNGNDELNDVNHSLKKVYINILIKVKKNLMPNTTKKEARLNY